MLTTVLPGGFGDRRHVQVDDAARIAGQRDFSLQLARIETAETAAGLRSSSCTKQRRTQPVADEKQGDRPPESTTNVSWLALRTGSK